MLTMEAGMEIKLPARHGLGIRAIARELGISRNTVKHYLSGEAVKPQRACRRCASTRSVTCRRVRSRWTNATIRAPLS